MEKFIVEGQHALKGTISPSGNKNEALPALTATLLTDQPVILENLPNIKDIVSLAKLLIQLGVRQEKLSAHTYQFDSRALYSYEPDFNLSQEIRGSFLLAAPLLYRFGKAKIAIPGGDSIGRRRLDTHLLAFQQMGVTITQEQNCYLMSCKKLQAANLFLDEASVTATENIIMAAAVAEGTTTIYNAACEPHVQGLCKMLNSMGANIHGIGSNYLTIKGVSNLHQCHYRIQPDHTEVGSLIGLAAVTNSEILIKEPGFDNLPLILHVFQRLGIQVQKQENDLLIPANQKMEITLDANHALPRIDDAPWPGFPADLTSIMTVVATQCQGTILIFEKLFESRLFWVDKLISMGAKIVLCDPHRAVIVGPSHLHSTILTSPDIRAGMALLIAALCAEGTSEIYNIHQIDRGYEKIEERLNALGAKIKRVSCS